MTNIDKDLFLHNLSIVTIIKNEAKYLNEWLDFHLLAGVDHFYIYDNDSTDNTKEILQPYIDKGIVDYFFDNGKYIQTKILNESLEKFRFYSRFIMYTDVDEFLVPKNSFLTIPKILERKTKKEAIGFGFPWVCFGSNGQTKADYSKRVIERFTMRSDQYSNSTKYIINPRRVERFAGVHYPYTLSNLKILFFQHYGSTIEKENNKPLRLHHYRVKSYEEFQNKIKRGNVNRKHTKPYYEASDFFSIYDQNKVLDTNAIIYMNEREKIGYTISKPDPVKILNGVKKVLNELNQNINREYIDIMENLLTVNNVLLYLYNNTFIKEDEFKIYMDNDLNLLYKVLSTLKDKEIDTIDLYVLTAPKLFKLDYPIIDDIKKISLKKIDIEVMKSKYINGTKVIKTRRNLLKVFENIRKEV